MEAEVQTGQTVVMSAILLIHNSRIFIRKVLDGCAALGYLLTFKWSNCKAVWEAHREYRVLRTQRPAAPDGIASVQGYWQGFLMLGGKKLRQTQLS